MAFITKDTDYAMRALVCIARNPGRIMTVKELSGLLDISHPYLRKLLQRLGTAGMLLSAKGKNGGFSIGRKAGDILLRDLVGLFQGDIGIRHCVVRSSDCPNIGNCLLHDKLRALENYFDRELGSMSIKALAATGRAARKKTRA